MKVKSPTSILTLSTIAMIISFAVWSVFAPIATEIQKVYGLSGLEKSILIATPILLGSVMRIPMGILTDRYGGRKIYAITLLLLVIPMIGAGFADSYHMLLFWAFFIGMAGTTFAVSIAYVSRWFSPEKQGLILGIAGMGNLGSALANFFIPLIFNSYGLEWVFWSLAFAMGVMAIIFWIGTKELQRPTETKTLKEALSVLKYKETWMLSAFYCLTFGGFVTFSMYLPTLLYDLFQITVVAAGVIAAGFVVIATFTRPIGGYISDRFGAKKVLTFVFSGVSFGGIAVAFTMESLTFFSLSCMFTGIMLGIGNGAVFKMVPEVSSENVGSVTGIVGAVGGIGGFIPPIFIGITKDLTGNYFLSFALLSILSLIFLILNHIIGNKARVIKHSESIGA